MPVAHRRSSHNDESIAESCTLSRRSLEENNYRICSKDCPTTALVLRASDGRCIILTFATLRVDGCWKLLAPLFLPAHQSGWSNHVGPRVHVNMDNLDQDSPPPITSFQFDLQKEQMIHLPEGMNTGKSYLDSRSSGTNITRQSHNRNKRCKSVNNSLNTFLKNCSMSKSSSDLVCDSSTLAVSDALVNDTSKIDKPVKRNSRKKAKKKGKQYKRLSSRKASIEETVSEGGICDVSFPETSTITNSSCSGEDMSEYILSKKASLPSLSVQATVEKADCGESISDFLNPSATPVAYMSCSDEMDEPERTTSFSDEFACDDFNCNHSATDESSVTLITSAAQNLETVPSNFGGNTVNAQNGNRVDTLCCMSSGPYDAPLFDSLLDDCNSDNTGNGGGVDVDTLSCSKEDGKVSSSEGETVLDDSGTTSHCLSAKSHDSEISSPYCLKDPVGPASFSDRMHCSSQACSSNSCNTSGPVLPGKRCRRSKKVSGSSDGVFRFGGDNMHARLGKDINYSVWQRVEKSTIEEPIYESKDIIPQSLQSDIASQGSEDQQENDAYLQLAQNETQEPCIYSSLNEMASVSDSPKLTSKIVDPTEHLCKSSGKLVSKVTEKLKKKSSSVPNHGHNDKKGPQTGKTKMTRLSKIPGQQKEASKASLPGHYDKGHTVVRSPHNSDFRRVVLSTDRAESCPSEPQVKTQHCANETTHTGNISSTNYDMTSQAFLNQISPLSRTLDSLDLKHMLEVNSDISDVEFHKDMHHNLCSLVDNEGKRCVKPENESSYAGHSKNDSISVPVLQKWIPVGKREAPLLNTSHINTLAHEKLKSKSIDAEQLSTDVDPNLPLIPNSGNVDNSSPVGKREAPFLNTNHINTLAHEKLKSKSIDAEQLSSGVDHTLPLIPNSGNVDYSSPVVAGVTGYLGYKAPSMSTDPNAVHTEFNSHSAEEVKNQNISDFETDLDMIMEVVKGACRLQTASEGVHLATGSPVAEFERLLHSASPMLGQMYNIRSCKSCSQDEPIGDSLCRHQIPNIPLRNLWQWYEKPGNYGLEVKAEDYHNSKRLGIDQFEFRAYFVPYLSAVQIFGQSRSSSCRIDGVSDGEMTKDYDTDSMSKNSSHLSTLPIFSMLLPRPCKKAVKDTLKSRSISSKDEVCNWSDSGTCPGAQELLFEYFESDQPQLRRPLFEKIKELIKGDTSSNSRTFGDPLKLESLNLRDIHPASWFSVAWYPIYRIPAGNLRAAFLTYHSLGHFTGRSALSYLPGEVTQIVSPVVGLQSYNAKGECWFQPRNSESKGMQTEAAASSSKPSEILTERLRTLGRTAAVMARATVRKGDRRSVNRQSDYEFFLSRGP